MRSFDLSLPTAEENLAGDEALLLDCESDGGEALRFWESTLPFVVVGYGNEVAREVNVAACAADCIPILRRCSGGGTVLQGCGCLNFALVLKITDAGPLATVTGTNELIMRRNADALSALMGDPVERCGDTDLVWRGRKFSGNAQRRRRTHLLFHGTFLLRFDLALMAKYLLPPSRQPAYRDGRPHDEFITNLPLPAAAVKRSLSSTWQVTEVGASWPALATSSLARERYANAEWNLRL